MGAGNGSHFFYVCNWKIFQAIVCAIVMEVIVNQQKLLEVARPMEVIGNLGVIGELPVIWKLCQIRPLLVVIGIPGVMIR